VTIACSNSGDISTGSRTPVAQHPLQVRLQRCVTLTKTKGGK